MRKIYMFFYCYCYFLSAYSQNSKDFTYYVELHNNNNVPVFASVNGKLAYTGNDLRQKQIFSTNEVKEFYQAFPDAIDKNLLNVYVLKTTNNKMVNDLLVNSKEIYKSSENLTERKIDFLDLPNDYGNTNPNPNANLGANVSRKDLDYLHVSDAWGITKGKANIRIGISDNQIKYDLLDLKDKVTITSTTIPYTSNSVTGDSHGTAVAAIAAAKGNNAHGSVGICMDCNIVEGSDIISYGSSVTMYSNLYKMAKAGAKVINMSWTNSGYTNSTTYSNTEQAVINDLVNNYRITLVAAAGNYPSFSTPQSFFSKIVNGIPTGIPETPFGILYVFPASYDNVISVSSIKYNYPVSLPLTNSQPSYCCTSAWFPIHVDLEDSMSYSIDASDPMHPVAVLRNGFFQNIYNPDGFNWSHTLNDKVDILAPGFDIFDYSKYTNNNSNPYSFGTSFSAPMVSGTIGLMLSINECLSSRENESILKLTTKDIESMNLNKNYNGYVGAGKLEIGNAVNFVNEMTKLNGNAVIKNHIFNRFYFFLPKINNQLTISNIVFKENCIADFTARNSIDVLTSDFIPNSSGSIDLKLDIAMNTSCSPIIFYKSSSKGKATIPENTCSKIILYPNPNNGFFTVNLGVEVNSDIELDVYTILGKLVHSSIIQKSIFEINLPNLASGLYIAKLKGKNYDETIKFIKE